MTTFEISFFLSAGVFRCGPLLPFVNPKAVMWLSLQHSRATEWPGNYKESGKRSGQGSLTARGRCWGRTSFHGFAIALDIDIFKPHFSDFHFSSIFWYSFTSKSIPLLSTEYMLCACLISHIRATCLAHIILLDAIISANDTWLTVQIMEPLGVNFLHPVPSSTKDWIFSTLLSDTV